MTTLRHRTDALAALLLAAAAAVSGCISHQETVRRDEDPLEIEFESQEASRIFFRAVEQRREDATPTESKTEFHVPVLLSHKVTTVYGPNRVRNQAVRRADANRNGTITEKEAQIFADSQR